MNSIIKVSALALMLAAGAAIAQQRPACSGRRARDGLFQARHER